MNRRLHPLIPFLLLAVGAPLAAAAQSNDPASAAATEQAATTEAAQTQDQASLDKDKDKRQRESPYCLQHTGSLIRQTGGRHRCTAIGDAYTRDDLQRTGATDIGDALRMLDSSIH